MSFGPAIAPNGAGEGEAEFEAGLGQVLMKFKPGDLDDLAYTGTSKPVDFEHWVRMTRVNLESRHSLMAEWWGRTYAAALQAHVIYLQLSPLERSDIRPRNDDYTVADQKIERYMRRHVLRSMPRHVQNTLLHVDVVTCSDVIFQALVDAGPGTEADRADTLKAVVAKSAVPVHNIYDKLHRWRFDMQRLQALGVASPDPSVQKAVIISYVSKLSEADSEFAYRPNAYKLTKNLQGAVSQPQVNEFWRYLASLTDQVSPQLVHLRLSHRSLQVLGELVRV